MGKKLVETTGEFMLRDINTGNLIASHRPSVVEESAFVHGRAAAGQIRILGDVSDDTTDADADEFYKSYKGDEKERGKAFLGRTPDPEPEPAPDPELAKEPHPTKTPEPAKEPKAKNPVK